MRARKVLVVGVGGLGVPALVSLVKTGISVHLGLVDPEVVELSNLSRQFIYGVKDIGRFKVDAAANYLLRRYHIWDVETYPVALSSSNAISLLEQYDFILDCTDDPITKFLINDTSLRLGRPFCYGGVLGFRGQAMTVVPSKTACLRCLFEQPPPANEVASCRDGGIIGPVAGLIGTIEAREALSYLSEGHSPLSGNLYLYDAVHKTGGRVIPVNQRPNCGCALSNSG